MFDPTYRPRDSLAEPWPERVWQIKPFFEQGVGQSIQRTMLLLKSSGLTAKEKKQRKNLQDQIEAWRKDPFDPHLVAGMRPEAYMKTTVMAYIENLLAWADHLFEQDTMETVNEATQLYILAAEILGKRPTEIAAHENTTRTINGEEVKTFNDLRGRLDAFSNALVQLETLIEPDSTPGEGGGIGSLLGSTDFAIAPVEDEETEFPLASNDLQPPEGDQPLVDIPLDNPVPSVLGPTLFFCIPGNDKLLGYWDTVADRLFKIRHCMNIDGVVRQLPLFQPPIDPGLLVKATAAGVDISSVLNDLNAPLLPYRFQVLLQKATELTREVVALGTSLLSVLEKKDAEALALLRADHEMRLLDSVKETRQQQITEAEDQKRALEDARDAAQFRADHYEQLQSAGWLDGELSQVLLAILSIGAQTAAGASNVEASNIAYNELDFSANVGTSAGGSVSVTLGALPSSSVGVNFGGSLGAGTSWGGSKRSAGTRAKAEEWSTLANQQQSMSNLLATNNSFSRRQEEWEFQKGNAENDVSQLETQIEAATIRIELTRNELRSHEIQMENTSEVGEFMRSKYTNRELYSWMVSQISTVYFQSYKLAFDLAKRAEKAFRHELGVTDSDFIKFGYWDSLKKGLLSGEKLYHDLKRMDVAYLEENYREFELTKHVSLNMLNPLALLRFKEEGRCNFELPEALFDCDYPGHYFRRVKSVSITIPAVTGPYTTVSCTLRLLRSSIRRLSTLLGGQYARDLDNDDPRFSDTFGAIQSIATSSGQNDSGLFELNFRDERYLPFEGAGVISRWQLELPNEFRQFNYDSISDVILHLNYTAREGGAALRDTANHHLQEAINALVTGENAPGLQQLFSIRHEFPTEFHRFLYPESESEQHLMTLNFGQDRFPYVFRGREIVVDSVHVYLQLSAAIADPGSADAEFTMIHPGGESSLDFSAPSGTFGKLFQVSVSDLTNSGPGEWALSVVNVDGIFEGEQGQLNPEAVENIIFILHYTVAE